MSTQKVMLGAMLLLFWGCKSGTEPSPELLAVGNGGSRQVLTGPEVRVEKMDALPTLFSGKNSRHFPMGINAFNEAAGSAYDGEGHYAPVAWRHDVIEVLGDPAIHGEVRAACSLRPSSNGAWACNAPRRHWAPGACAMVE